MNNLCPDAIASKCRIIRKHIIEMVHAAGSGHPGGSLSCVEILSVLFFNIMKYNATNPNWQARDYFFPSKGHITPVYYAVLAEAGFFDTKLLKTFRKFGSPLQGHPSKASGLPGVEISSGSLGQGLSIACGASLGIKHRQMGNNIFCLTGDGELQEGSIWEAAMMAAHYKLDNLCWIIDNNHLQIDGETKKVMNIEPLADKIKSFGWHVENIDGHSVEQLINTFEQFRKSKNIPFAIIANTIKGKGISFMENQPKWHGKAPSDEELILALKELSE